MDNSIDINSLIEACKRIDLFTFCNWLEQTVYFIYRDERTLTIGQEAAIRSLIRQHLPGYEVVFGKCKSVT